MYVCIHIYIYIYICPYIYMYNEHIHVSNEAKDEREEEDVMCVKESHLRCSLRYSQRRTYYRPNFRRRSLES